MLVKSKSISLLLVCLGLTFLVPLETQPLHAANLEGNLVLNSSMGKDVTNSALEAFKEYAKKKYKVDVKVGALHGGGQLIYSKVIEWKGQSQADILWGSDAWMFTDLGEKGLAVKLDLNKEVTDRVPASYGEPRPLEMKDPARYWIGTSLVPWAVSYNPKLLKKLGVPPIQTWDDLLNPKLKDQIVSCTPDRSSSSHAAVEAQLQRLGWEKGWIFLKNMAANVHVFVARSNDVASSTARGEAAVGFGTTGFGAFDLRKGGYDIKMAVVPYSYITPEPIGILAGAKNPNTAKAFIEFLLSDEGQKVLVESGCFPIVKDFRVSGPEGSLMEMAADLYGMRSFYDKPLYNIIDEDLSQKRYQEINQKYQDEIVKVLSKLKEKR